LRAKILPINKVSHWDRLSNIYPDKKDPAKQVINLLLGTLLFFWLMPVLKNCKHTKGNNNLI
jgi:hypothetical protein